MRIAVVGAGTMGNGIAQVAATTGHEVILSDIEAGIVEKAVARIEKSLRKLSEKGKIEEDPASILGRIQTTTGLADLSGADFVVEAALEELGVKEKLFAELDATCAKAKALATNTSSISITQIAAVTKTPERVIGMHFMNPVPLMKLVEVIRGYHTSDEVYRATEELATTMGKTPVEVNDSAGFVSNRVLLPMINEAVFALYEGVGTAEAIDTVMKLGMNHPMGPLALADLIGLDVCLNILEVLHNEFKDPKYRPCPLLVKMVRAGDLGRKTGRGFYSYEK
jgi:3-hydroxybutyryl-CoA dehydrogenase